MKFLTATTILLFTFAANAHFKIGNYDGTFADGLKQGTACSFEIKGVSFKNDKHHPLNENVSIKLNYASQAELTFSHLAIVDAVAGTVRPKARVLSSVSANDTGAEAYELIMNEDGPVQMIYLVDNYRNADENRRVTCANLKYRE
jgi:hypothetical protein